MPLTATQLGGIVTDRNGRTKLYKAYFLARDVDGRELMEEDLSFEEILGGFAGMSLYPLGLTEGQGSGE
jgi:hypothetical protein